MTGVFEVHSVEETWALARQFASELKPGDVVCLEGDLGAGKTTFTQGLAAALGVDGRVTSPTFCLVQEHRRNNRIIECSNNRNGEIIELSNNRIIECEKDGLNGAMSTANSKIRKFDYSNISLLVHMDLYRLHDEDDVLAIGWEDYLSEGAILVVEWPERAGSLIPPTAKHVVFTHLDGEENRRIEFCAGGGVR